MANGEEQIQRLIAEGEYWRALGLKAGASPREVILRVMELGDQYPNLRGELNRLQTALTTKQEPYECACQVRDQVYRKIAKQLGKVAFDLLPKATVWRQVWEKVSTHPSAASRRLATEIWRDISQVIDSVPSVEITLLEARKGEAERISQRRDCRICDGSGHVDCATCTGTGGMKVELSGRKLIERIHSNREFRRAWEKSLIQQGIPLTIADHLSGNVTIATHEPCTKCAGRGRMPCSCISKKVLKIPKGVRAGWVVRAGAQDYARISKIVPVSAQQVREWIVKGRYWGRAISSYAFSLVWYPVGQLLTLVIGLLSLGEGPWKISARISLQEQLTAGVNYGSRVLNDVHDVLTTAQRMRRMGFRYPERFPEVGLPEQGGILLLLGGFLLIVLLVMTLKHWRYSGSRWGQALYNTYAALWRPLFRFLNPFGGTWTPPLSGLVVGMIKLLYYATSLLSSPWFTLPLAFAGGLVGLLSLLAGWGSNHLAVSVLGGYGLLVAIQLILPVLSRPQQAESTQRPVTPEKREVVKLENQICQRCGAQAAPGKLFCPSCQKTFNEEVFKSIDVDKVRVILPVLSRPRQAGSTQRPKGKASASQRLTALGVVVHDLQECETDTLHEEELPELENNFQWLRKWRREQQDPIMHVSQELIDRLIRGEAADDEDNS